MARASIGHDGASGFSPFIAFVGGGVVAFLATRVLPPMVAQLLGTVRDPFDALAADHRRVLAALDRVVQINDSRVASRGLALLKIKRSLTAHALAEEDVVYPALKLQA